MSTVGAGRAGLLAAAVLALAGPTLAGCAASTVAPPGSAAPAAGAPAGPTPARGPLSPTASEPAPSTATPPTPSAVRGPTPSEPGRCRVLEDGPDTVQVAARLRDACERALPTVAGLWPAWTGPAPLLVSATALPPGVAAQVRGRGRAGEPTVEDRIVVAPGLTDRLGDEGLEVVLRHELTHLAMRSTGTMPLPRWLGEGLASHVAYAAVEDDRRHRIPELTRLRARVEAGVRPGALPGAAAFDDAAQRSDADVAAWLAVEVLIVELGREGVVEALQRGAGDPAVSASDGERTGRVLASLGVSRAWLEERWRAELVRRTT